MVRNALEFVMEVLCGYGVMWFECRVMWLLYGCKYGVLDYEDGLGWCLKTHSHV